MLTPEQIAAIRDQAGHITEPITNYLLQDIARRIVDAGQLTASASYQIELAQKLGLARKEIEKELKRLLKVSEGELKTLLTQSAEVGYRFDLSRFGVEPVPFEENATLQQIVEASVKLATDEFKNITQTLGMVDPYGHALPLQDVYRNSMDFALEKVATGATDFNTAVRDATKNLAKYGVRSIDYQSGVHRSLEAAVRGSIMGGLGLMQEQISQQNHDDMGADGWEISAHAASAPDHEPIQGRQYTDAEYTALNNSLVRRIGTLNCGHVAFPIILGVNEPQYTEEQLEEFRRQNEKGITYHGKHYTMYEATQTQRKLERSMRTTKRKILLDEGRKDDEQLLYDQIRLRRIDEEYKRFSKTAGLPTQRERAQVYGFGRSQSSSAIGKGVRQIKMIESFKAEMSNCGYVVNGFDYYIGDEQTLDGILQAFKLMSSEYPEIPKNITISLDQWKLKDPPSDSVFSWFDPKLNNIGLNVDKFKYWDVLQEEYSRLVDSKLFPKGTTPLAAIYHECGHALIKIRNIRNLRKPIDNTLKKIGYQNMTVNLREMALKKELSIYSTDDLIIYEEVVAESLSEWYNSDSPRRFCENFLKEIKLI